ncbi:MAG: protease inhibitor I42 family protein [Halobacteriota archaeon]
MEKVRVFIVCVFSALLALTVVAAGCTSSTSTNNTSTASTETHENVSMTITTNATNVTQGERLTAAQGQNFTITLRSNPSTGYQWEPQFDSTALTLVDNVFSSDPNPNKLVGVPGSQVFTFHTLTNGTTTITFNYVSPSQIVTERAVYAVTVT